MKIEPAEKSRCEKSKKERAAKTYTMAEKVKTTEIEHVRGGD